MDEHGCDAAHQEIVQAILSLRDDVEAIRKKVDDEIIGGLTDLYGERVKSESIEGMKGAYGEQFSPYEADYQTLSGKDMWENLYEEVKDLADEEREPKILELFNELKSRFDKIKGEGPDKGPAPEGMVVVGEGKISDEDKGGPTGEDEQAEMADKEKDTGAVSEDEDELPPDIMREIKMLKKHPRVGVH